MHNNACNAVQCTQSSLYTNIFAWLSFHDPHTSCIITMQQFASQPLIIDMSYESHEHCHSLNADCKTSYWSPSFQPQIIDSFGVQSIMTSPMKALEHMKCHWDIETEWQTAKLTFLYTLLCSNIIQIHNNHGSVLCYIFPFFSFSSFFSWYHLQSVCQSLSFYAFSISFLEHSSFLSRLKYEWVSPPLSLPRAPRQGHS